MDNQINIKKLLEKFQKGEVSSQELGFLYELLKKEENAEIFSLIDEEWRKIGKKDKSVYNPSLLDRIHEKVRLKDHHMMILRQRRIIRRIWQYAAVFVVAFLLSWILKPSSLVPIADKSAENVNFFKINVPYGSKTTIVLPDSSEVVLNSGSVLEYPDHFGANDRTVLLKGEAYFDVKRNKHKPFFVKTDDMIIKVLGTQFNVKSYPDENIMETLLVSGSVEIMPNNRVFNGKKHVYKKILLKPNEKAVFMHNTTAVTPVKNIRKPMGNRVLSASIALQMAKKTETDIAWKSNILIFNNEPFDQIIRKLERWYDVRITLDYKGLSDVRFSARFNGETIIDVLDALSYAQPFKCEINKNQITIKNLK